MSQSCRRSPAGVVLAVAAADVDADVAEEDKDVECCGFGGGSCMVVAAVGGVSVMLVAVVANPEGGGVVAMVGFANRCVPTMEADGKRK